MKYKTSGVMNVKSHVELRKKLRTNLPLAEKLLWNDLRHKQLGVKFRRQHGVGSYIVDFYCAECSLVIELDGDTHFTEHAMAYDKIRDDYMCNLGLTVLRFLNTDVLQNKRSVLEKILGYVGVVIDAPSL
jgi:very-short-patch-repair endonuclease